MPLIKGDSRKFVSCVTTGQYSARVAQFVASDSRPNRHERDASLQTPIYS